MPRVPGQERGFLWGRDPGPVCLGTPPAHQALGLGPGLLEALVAPASPGSRPGSAGSTGSNSPPSADLGRPGPGVRGPHCLAWSGSDLAPWPGVTICPHRISPHQQAGRATPLTPCGPPQSLHRAHCSRPLLRPDPSGGTVAPPLCPHPPTQEPPAPCTKPRLGSARPRDLPARPPCQERPAPGPV